MNLDNSEQNNSRVEHTRNPQDDKIRLSIYKKLGDESGIDVHVRKGVVRLTGEVDHQVMVESAEESVREIPGVLDVENDLRVKLFNL